MALFGKLKAGGFMDEIRCDEPSYLIWKWHPAGSQADNNNRENAIRWGSSLRVKDGEVAVFVYNQNNGIMQDFIEGPFDQIIETENLPVLASIIGLAYQGGTPFQAEVYFINMARVIQIPFAVPYFDLYDPRYLDFGVPTAVRGKITFNISDYKEFIKLHRLASFDLNAFQTQVKDAMSRYVKGVVTNIPAEMNIPVVQIERAIEPINEMVEANVRERFERDFAVTITAVDINAVEVDKTSEGYQQLKAVTQDLAAATAQAQNQVYIKNMQDMQRVTGMAMGSAITPNIAGMMPGMSDLQGGIQQSPQGMTPPPIPNLAYFVVQNGQAVGPFDMMALSQMVSVGALTKDSLVWKQGMTDWVKAETVQELQSLFSFAVPPVPPVPPLV